MLTTKLPIVGVTFKNEDGVRRQDLLGVLYDDFYMEGFEDEIVLELRREPDNPADSNAVAVYCLEPEVGRGRLGFVPSGQAQFVGDALKGGRVHSVELHSMGTRKGAKVYAKIDVQIGEARVFETPKRIKDSQGRVYEF